MSEETLDKLGGQEAHRIREASVMVSTDADLPREKLEEIRANARRRMKSLGLDEGLLVQKCGSNKTYINNFLNGKFDAIPAATLQRLARAVNERIEDAHRRKKRELLAGFVNTRVAERMLKVARHLVETRDIGIVHAPAGTGKTTTALEIQRQWVTPLYLYITPDSARKTGFLRALYAIAWEHRGPNRPTLSDVIDRLKFSDRLLMLDNFDLAHPDIYPILMALHDVAQIPIMLIGTHKLLAKLTHDADPLRGQMASRIGLRAELLAEQTSPRRAGKRSEWIRADELRAIFERGRVKLHPNVVSRLKEYANYSVGRLRRVERYLRYALQFVPDRSGTALITEDVLEQAITLVDGDAVPAPPPGRPEALEVSA